MEKKEVFVITFVLILLTGLFFNKTIFKGQVPFPGDSLIAEYKPWQTSSYLEYNPGSYPHKAQYPDTLRQLYPWRTLSIRQWQEGKTPLWNPYNFSGAPLLANFQSAALYPLNVFFWFFAHVDAWTLLVILQPILAALFTYLYARKIGLAPLGAALSGISYGFSGFMMVWLEYNTVGHVILWLPLLLLAVEQLAKKPTAFWLMAFAAGNTLGLLAGHPQIYAYMLAFVAVYAMFRIRDIKRLGLLGLITFLGIGMAAVQLIPGIELIRYAARSPHEFGRLFEKILIQPWQLLALPFPNIFGNPATRTYWPTDTFIGKVTTIGLIPLLFFLSAIRSKKPLAKFYLWASVAVLVLMSANPITFLLYKLPIPLINSSSPTLMSFLLAFAFSMFAGFGLDFWMTEKHTLRKLFVRTLQVGAVLLAIVILHHTPTSQRAMLYAGGLAAAALFLWGIAIKMPKRRHLAMIALLALHAVDLFIFSNRFNPFVPKEIVFPAHEITTFLASRALDRFWGYGSAAMQANFATQFGIFSPEGYDPLYPRWYGEFLHGSYDGKLLSAFDNQTRSDAVIAPGFGEEGFASPQRQRVLDATSVKYILDRSENGSTAKTFSPSIFRTIYNENSWQIMENANAAPRVFLTTDIVTYENREDFTVKFFDPSFDPSRQVLLPIMPALTYPLDQNGTASIVSYEENSVTMTTQSNSPAVLVLTDTYYPGWKAWVDDKEAPILRADWTLRAVPVPQGEHTVVMRYMPTSYTLGKVISIASFILLCVIVIL